VDGARNGPFLPFLPLAHVDEECLALPLARFGRADLVDLRLDLREQLPVRGHLCRKR
jgi:hypothetical protein